MTHGSRRLSGGWKSTKWLFRQNGFNISNTVYSLFVYADTSRVPFSDTPAYTSQNFPYPGNNASVEAAVVGAHTSLCSVVGPAPSDGSDWCAYCGAGNGPPRRQVTTHYRPSNGQSSPICRP